MNKSFLGLIVVAFIFLSCFLTSCMSGSTLTTVIGELGTVTPTVTTTATTVITVVPTNTVVYLVPDDDIYTDPQSDEDRELSNVLTAVTACMADAETYSVVSDGHTENFGNTGHALKPPFAGVDFTVAPGYVVGDYLAGGAVNVAGSYIIAADGRVIQTWYPGR